MKRFIFATLALVFAFALTPVAGIQAQQQQNANPNVVQTLNVTITPPCGTPDHIKSLADARFTQAITAVASYTAPTSPTGLSSPAATLTAAQTAMDAALDQGTANNAAYACVSYHWFVKVMLDNSAIIIQQRTISGQWGVTFPTV